MEQEAGEKKSFGTNSNIPERTVAIVLILGLSGRYCADFRLERQAPRKSRTLRTRRSQAEVTLPV